MLKPPLEAEVKAELLVMGGTIACLVPVFSCCNR